jgi:hypothetical protein
MLSFFALLLVIAVLQARTSAAKALSHPVNLPNFSYKFIPGSIIENNCINYLYAEISMQTFNPQSELKKTVHLICNDIFHINQVHFFDKEIVFENASFPSTPLYISYCTILI